MKRKPKRKRVNYNLTPAKIRQIRSVLGDVQEEFADRLGVTIATVSGWENGRHVPTTLKHRADLMRLWDS